MPVVVLILVFAIIAPAGAMYNPHDNNQLIKRMIDDHPWGGDAVPTHNVPDRSGAPVQSIDLPFIYVDFYHIIIIGDFRSENNSPQDDQQNNQILPEDYNNSDYNNQNLPVRGN